MSWAEEAAKRKRESEQSQGVANELAAHELKLKKEIGPKAIQQLLAYLQQEAKKYNELLKREELKVTHSVNLNTGSVMFEHEIKISHAGNKKAPLTIEYSETSHILRYDGIAGVGEFSLVIENGKGCFESPYHKRYSIEELGQFLLDHFEKAPF